MYLVKEDDVVKVINKISRVKVDVSTKDEKTKLFNLASSVKNRVFGQEQYIDEIAEKIMLYKAGMIEKGKPIGAWLLSGPSGVGKTELCKVFADELGMKLLRFDMSEFMEQHSVSKFIGTSAGYVGYEEGGNLIEEIKKHPSSVLLFDEIEKAHPQILSIFLQMLEESEITAGNGQKVSLKDCLIFFTSNLSDKSEKSMGFFNDRAYKKTKILEEGFPSEFRNRLDNIFIFNALEKEFLIKIIDKEIKNIEKSIEGKKLKINIHKDVYEYLIKNGTNDDMGARPLKKLITKEIKIPLSKAVLFDNLKDNITIKLSIKEEKIKLDFSSKS